MSDLIIEGAGGVKDGLYVIKDGELFKYKQNGGTVRSYHIKPISQRSMYQAGYRQAQEDRPRGYWKHNTTYKSLVFCSECDMPYEAGMTPRNFCPNCGADMRSE